MAMNCPACEHAIQVEDVNVRTDAALCRACGHSCRASELVHDDALVAINLNQLPKGVSIDDDGRRWTIKVKNNSWLGAAVISGFVLIWGGIPVGAVVNKAYQGQPIDLVLIIFALIFGSIAVLFLYGALLMAIGSLTVSIAGKECIIRSGIGALSSTRRFEVSASTRVTFDYRCTGRGGVTEFIVLHANRPIELGHELDEQRRTFVHAALSKRLRDATKPHSV